MHELAIANSIVRTVLEAMDRDGYTAVTRVGLHIGALTDVVPEALVFGFEAIVKGTALEHTRLDIEQIPIKGKCRECGGEFTIEEFSFVCPLCSGRDIAMSQGDELDITYLEVENEEGG